MPTSTNPVSNSDLLNNYVQQQQQAAAAAAAAEKAKNSANGNIASNFNTFLKILTTQLTHQDPTNATDTNQFTQQLVQFSQVEQQLNTNSNLQKLINLAAGNSLSAGIGYIGNYVEASTPKGDIALQDGKAHMGYTLPSAASNVTITIKNAEGAVVRTMEGQGVNGVNYATWDGKSEGGTQLPDGVYTFEVKATDSSNTILAVTNPKTLAKVSAIQTASDGTLQLTCGVLAVSNANIDAVYANGSLPSQTFTPPNS